MSLTDHPRQVTTATFGANRWVLAFRRDKEATGLVLLGDKGINVVTGGQCDGPGYSFAIITGRTV